MSAVAFLGNVSRAPANSREKRSEILAGEPSHPSQQSRTIAGPIFVRQQADGFLGAIAVARNQGRLAAAENGFGRYTSAHRHAFMKRLKARSSCS